MASSACLHLKHIHSSLSPSDSLPPFISFLLAPSFPPPSFFSSLLPPIEPSIHRSTTSTSTSTFFPSSSSLLLYVMSHFTGSQEHSSGPPQKYGGGAHSQQKDDQRGNLQLSQRESQELRYESQERRSRSHETETSHQREAAHQHSRKVLILRQARRLALWFVMSWCALMWTIVIIGGIVVLVVYLFYRPKSPRLDIQSATLNAAYLDTGTLLNADITILANFSNPNRKVNVAFSYVQVDLYFMGTMIATQAVEPFAERRRESALKSLHMVASDVALPRDAAAEWRRGTSEEGVALEVKGRFRTRSDLGKWLHFTYWLYGRCTIVIGAPPSGVLLSSRCRTKR